MIFGVFLALFVAVHGSVMHEARHPQPYSFGYSIKDHEGAQHRQETGNGAGALHGNYGFIDNKGHRRQVDYVADHHGFRAQVKTNEPGTARQSPAAVHMMSNAHYGHESTVPHAPRAAPSHYEPIGVHRVPAILGHRAYNYGHEEPTQGYKFITPVRENSHHMSSPMQSHHHNQHLLAPVAVQHRDYHMPARIPVHGDVMQHHASIHMPVHNRHMPIYVPVYEHEHYISVDAPVRYRDQHMSHPVHDYHVPHHTSVHHEHNPAMYSHGYDQMYGSHYMGGLAHGNLLGAGYRGYKGVNYSTNLKGGVIRGHDSRFTNLMKH